MKVKRLQKQNIIKLLDENRIIILYGPRRTGKTTLVKEISQEYNGKYFNSENTEVQSAFADNKSPQDLRQFLGDGELFILDEAQTIVNIGRKLKLIYDTYPDIKLIVTGSSSFDLANEIVEPLTGRKFELFLYPLSLAEMQTELGNLAFTERIDDILKYGTYPEIVSRDFINVEIILQELAGSYLFKDILTYQEIKGTTTLRILLQALALQLGSEVSYNELANKVGVDKNTITKYLDLLEKSFIIFRLNSFSRNLRSELDKSKKYFFYDLGLRNALLNQFNDIQLRNDVGALWENFMIIERIKFNHYRQYNANYYFWRTYDQLEIDFIEERNGQFTIFEAKFSGAQKPKAFHKFAKQYTVSNELIYSKDNLFELTSL